MHRNVEGVLKECHGEYVAFLEGDDYWTSENKLQLQADVLSARNRVAGVFHPVALVNSLGKETGVVWPDKAVEELQTRELLETNLLPTGSVMIRRGALVDLPDRYRKLNMRDWPMWVYGSLYGPWLCLPRLMAAYRVHDGGRWSSLSDAARLDAIIALFQMFAADLPAHLSGIARRQLARTRLERLEWALDHGPPTDSGRELREILRLLPYYPMSESKRLVSALWQFASPGTRSLVKRMLRRTPPKPANRR
jgi:hypothetical protein